MEKTFHHKGFGYKIVTGKFAQQANGAVWLQKGGTVVLATATMSPSEDFPGFLPLTVDYREQMAAAGKIPGGYFKREGKMTDKEILTGRLIDRALRPLFPENFFDQVQILVTVYSVDKDHTPSTLALLAASAALETSNIPFLGPVGVAEVGRVNGEWIYNPTYSQILESDVKITVAGTQEGINMVEGSMNEISESELVDLLFNAHEKIKEQVAWQKEIAQSLDISKEKVNEHTDWTYWRQKALESLTDDDIKRVFVKDKIERNEVISELKESFLERNKETIEEKDISEKILKYVFEEALKKKITEKIFELGKRIDLRDFEDVRNISVEVGLLPFTHGSALFTRGRTQALVTVTLGGGQDEQKVEELMGNTLEKSFMLHYNFPPFSVGEVRPMRGPGRREIGHGYLAASALESVLPLKEEFPYTMRVVADMLESNGSTSMATVCGSTMALMNAGVPIKKMVSGVAMGLIGSPDGKFQTLTDINGKEDAFGLMDFKVTGTDDGITAIQMDIKYKGGLPRDVFESALAQAKRGRDHIMKEMRTVMTAPSPNLSDLVPKVVSFKVPTDKIGAIIGGGGKTIKDIIEKTDTSIDIGPDGVVKIFGQPGAKMETAISWVKVLGGLIEKGDQYPGIVKRVTDFGVFVELAPGQDGLVHISTIPREEQKDLQKLYPVNTQVRVEVLDYDQVSGRIRLKFIK